MTQRRRTPGRSSNRARSWQVPLSVAVIVISVVAIWRLSGGLFDDDGGGITIPNEPDDEISAFWVDGGRDLLTDWRTTAPRIVQGIATGRDCLQSEEIKPTACPDLPEEYQGYRGELTALIERADALERPVDSTADEWLRALVLAWSSQEQSLGTYAQLGLEGYRDDPWLAHQERYREQVIPAFTDAEFALARMLGEVAPELLGTTSQ